MLKMNMQFESQYNLRQYGSVAMDSRSIGFADGALVSSRQFPGAAQPDAGFSSGFSGFSGYIGGAIDGLPMSSTGTLTGLMPSISNGGTIGASTSTSTFSATISGGNHLTAPTGVAAADTGLGTGGSTYSLTVTWTNAAAYGSNDIVICYNNSGNGVLGMAASTSGTMQINGLTNTAYTVYLKNTCNFVNFSPASNTASATPTGVNVNLPSAANVLAGVPVGVTVGTLDVAAAVMAKAIETEGGGLTVKQALQLISAVMFGVDTVSGGTVTFKDSTGTNNRVVATMSGNQRTAITTTTSP